MKTLIECREAWCGWVGECGPIARCGNPSCGSNMVRPVDPAKKIRKFANTAHGESEAGLRPVDDETVCRLLAHGGTIDGETEVGPEGAFRLALSLRDARAEITRLRTAIIDDFAKGVAS